jgi:formylglycine-generating enzyme required for sulfatase activity
MSSRRWLTAALSILAVAAGLSAARGLADDEPAKYAFIVGINKYQKRSFADLEFAERDAQDLADVLRGLSFEVVLLRGSADGELKATREGIEGQLKILLKRVKKNDLLLVSLSGHGAQFESRLADGTRKEDAYFCPVEAVANDTQTLFSLSYLIDDLLANQGGRNLVLVDACRDQPRDPSRGSRGIQGRSINLPENTAVMFSCKAEQQSYESAEAGGGHGLFTYCVLEGLQGGAARGGEITWSALTSHVEDRMVSTEVRKWIPSGREQVPLPTGNVERTVLGRLAAATNLEGRRAGEERADNGLKMKLVWCPAGEFTMGSSDSDKDAGDDEKPAVKVTLTRGFWLGKNEVTQREWGRIIGTTPWKKFDNAKTGADYPAWFVDWQDATEFCRDLTDAERQAGRLPKGWEYTLPTEAQWEYGCRARDTSSFSFGDDADKLSNYAWFRKNSGDIGDDYPHRVAQKKPNGWGLYDMHGNVAEWCRDRLSSHKYKLPAGGDAEDTSERGDWRVQRGGAWFGAAAECRSAYRYFTLGNFGDHRAGFRVALCPVK